MLSAFQPRMDTQKKSCTEVMMIEEGVGGQQPTAVMMARHTLALPPRRHVLASALPESQWKYSNSSGRPGVERSTRMCGYRLLAVSSPMPDSYFRHTNTVSLNSATEGLVDL